MFFIYLIILIIILLFVTSKLTYRYDQMRVYLVLIWPNFSPEVLNPKGLKPGFLLYRDENRELCQVCNSPAQRLHNAELKKYRTHHLKYYAAR